MKLILLASTLLIMTKVWADCSPKTVHYKKENFAIEVLNYLPDSPKSHVIIIPPTGGTNFLDRRYASGLCDRGINAHILSHWTDDDEYNVELSIHTRFYGRAYEAIGLLLSELPAKTRIGILGTSVGGLHAAIAASRYQQISSAFIITGGAHIPSIIANSNQGAMVKVWNDRSRLFNFKAKGEYIDALEKVIELEPLNRLNITSAKKFGMVISTSDQTVPSVNQERLKSLWKPEVVIYKDQDHFWSIVNTWLFDSDKIYSFFDS